MRLPKFEYFGAGSVAEACDYLAQHQGEAKVLAGGTDLLVAMKLGSVKPRYLVSLKAVTGLDSITVSDEHISLGPRLSLAAVASSPIIRDNLPALAQAAAAAASPELRNAGTLGGNICLDNRCTYYNQSDSWRRNWETCFKYGGERCYIIKGGDKCYALASADTVPALLALDASVRLVSKDAERILPLEQFYTGNGDVPNVLQSDEIVSEIIVPRPQAGSHSAFKKMARRQSIDFPLLNVAIALNLRDDTCEDARMALSAVGPAPLRARGAERILAGKHLTSNIIQEAAMQSSKELGPISSIGTTVSYRRQMINVQVRRTIERLALRNQPNLPEKDA